MRAFSVLVWLIFPVLLAACGSSGGGQQVSLEDLFPASGEISGWEEDTAQGAAGPEVTSDRATAYEWADGAMDTFDQVGGWVALGREFYVKGDTKVELDIFEMTDEQKAAEVYRQLAGYSGISWEDFDFGAGQSLGRFGCATPFYCGANAVKGKYFVETQTEPHTAEADAKAFFTAVLQRIP